MLGPGEREVLMLGLRTPDSVLLTDDRAARREATVLGLSTKGSLGILVDAARAGLLSRQARDAAFNQIAGADTIWLNPVLVMRVRESLDTDV